MYSISTYNALLWNKSKFVPHTTLKVVTIVTLQYVYINSDLVKYILILYPCIHLYIISTKSAAEV